MHMETEIWFAHVCNNALKCDDYQMNIKKLKKCTGNVKHAKTIFSNLVVKEFFSFFI